MFSTAVKGRTTGQTHTQNILRSHASWWEFALFVCIVSLLQQICFFLGFFFYFQMPLGILKGYFFVCVCFSAHVYAPLCTCVWFTRIPRSRARPRGLTPSGLGCVAECPAAQRGRDPRGGGREDERHLKADTPLEPAGKLLLPQTHLI